MNNKIFISAGDFSGEMHACSLVREIKKISPSCHVCAVGGNNLRSIVDKFLEDIVNINAFGFFSLKKAFYLKKVFDKLKYYFIKERPDKIVLVDYYGFHIFIARLAKKFKIPVYYYISPQIWASRRNRIKKLGRIVKKMLVILPFEEKLYKNYGVNVIFVGNPLIDTVFEKNSFEISNPPIIGLFPGSRKDTVKRHMPILLKVANILKEKINARFIMFVVANKINIDVPKYIEIENFSGNFEKRMSINFAICPSGTVSLENALMGIPMVTMYKLSYLNYFFIRLIIKVKYITMVNILSKKIIVPEFIQFNAKPKKIVCSVLNQLKPKNYVFKVKELIAFRKILGAPGVSRRVAEIILND
jgi:lipid-A-disaccharide synthase